MGVRGGRGGSLVARVRGVLLTRVETPKRKQHEKIDRKEERIAKTAER